MAKEWRAVKLNTSSFNARNLGNLGKRLEHCSQLEIRIKLALVNLPENAWVGSITSRNAYAPHTASDSQPRIMHMPPMGVMAPRAFTWLRTRA